MTFTGAAVVAGVVGWPISHSRSPAIHNYWIRKYGINGIYVPLAVPPERAAEAFHALPALGLKGVNVTAPHKEAAYRAMDETDPEAARMEAVNTVVVREDGSLFGRNTDSFGFLASLREHCPSWEPGTGTAVILGAGGASRAIVDGLQHAGVSDIVLVNRSADRATRVAEALGPPVSTGPWEQKSQLIANASLLVNTTLLGMSGKPTLDIDLSRLPLTAIVCDIVYTPLETSLLAAARQRGNPTVEGLGMLLHQARPGFHAWFGRDPVVDQELRSHILGQTPI